MLTIELTLDPDFQDPAGVPLRALALLFEGGSLGSFVGTTYTFALYIHKIGVVETPTLNQSGGP